MINSSQTTAPRTIHQNGETFAHAGFEPEGHIESDTETIITRGLVEREKLGWGPKYAPTLGDRKSEQEFSTLVTELLLLARELPNYLEGDGALSDEGYSLIVEVTESFEQLGRCSFGQDEFLAKICAVVLAQIRNSDISRAHVEFLVDTLEFLAAQTLIDDTALDVVFDVVEKHQLESYRGTLTETNIRRKYRIVAAE